MLSKTTQSADGTVKLDFTQGHTAVLIPSGQGKWTLCVSSQYGCAVGCSFCYTGKLGFRKNLTSEEIVEQVEEAQKHLGRSPDSVVFMGMGEPMLNFAHVLLAVEKINGQFGIAFRKITLSTSGIKLDKLAEAIETKKLRCNLALSLHSPFDAVREKLMPGSMYSMQELFDFVCKVAPLLKYGVMIEYALMHDVNDREEDLKKLFSFNWPQNSNFNFIEFNDCGDFRRSSLSKLETFKEAARAQGYKSFIRRSRGQDIEAACGMLEQRS